MNNSANHHQQRGRAWDIIDEAICEYDEWMLDDDFEPGLALNKIMSRMKERRDLAQPTFAEFIQNFDPDGKGNAERSTPVAEAAHPKCETCSYFEPPRPDAECITSEIGKGLCTQTKHDAEVTMWDDDCNDVLKEEFRDRTAFVSDGSGYHAALRPSPKHYCPMHSSLSQQEGG